MATFLHYALLTIAGLAAYFLIGFLLSGVIFRMYKFFIRRQSTEDYKKYHVDHIGPPWPESESQNSEQKIDWSVYGYIASRFAFDRHFAESFPRMVKLNKFQDYIRDLTKPELQSHEVTVIFWPIKIPILVLRNLVALVPPFIRKFGKLLYGNPVVPSIK